MICNTLTRTALLLLATLVCCIPCHAEQTIAIEFTQENCVYCRQLEKTLDPLIAAGFAVRKIDVNAPAGAIPGTTKSGQQLAAAYGVRTTPTIVVQTYGDDGKPQLDSVRRLDHSQPAALRERLLAAGVHYLPPAPQTK